MLQILSSTVLHQNETSETAAFYVAYKSVFVLKWGMNFKYKHMVQKRTFSLLPYIRMEKQNDLGQAPLYLRVTVNGKRVVVSMKLFIDPQKWKAGNGRLKGTSEEAKRVNATIDSFEYRARSIYNHLIEKGKLVTAEAIKDELTGAVHKQRTLVLAFDQFVREIELKIGNEYAAGTVKNWKVTQRHLKKFILDNYATSVLPFKSLDLKFLSDFGLYARTTWNCRTNAVLKHIQRIRKNVIEVVACGWLDKDPFIGFSGKWEKTKRTFLSAEELKAVESKIIMTERLERVRDIFIFSCYTGLAYVDVEKLTVDNLVIGIDGKKWIYTFKEKTDGKSNVPLLPQALVIVEKYRNHPRLEDPITIAHLCQLA
jgi:integrase